MRTLILISLLVFVCVCLIAETSAYPIAPRTLRRLTNDSELIVVARVDNVTPLRNAGDGSDWDTALARLEVISVVKGKVHNHYLSVPYPADLACPAPPHYEVGDTVLAFLTPSEFGSYYITAGLSYGSKSLNRDEIDIYSARIRELVEIEKQTNTDTRLQQLVEWMVLCAEHPTTRWEGAYDLLDSHRLKMMEEKLGKKLVAIAPGHYVVENKLYGVVQKERTIDFSAMLSLDQKRRLMNSLYNANSISAGGFELIELVEIWGDENLTPFIWSYLKSFKNDHLWNTKRLMTKLATSLNNYWARKLAERYDSLIDTDQEGAAIKLEFNQAILRQFIVAIERSGPPRTIEIKNQPEPATESKMGLHAFSGIIGFKNLSVFSLPLSGLSHFETINSDGLVTVLSLILFFFILAVTLCKRS
jgi:hypothetical protein